MRWAVVYKDVAGGHVIFGNSLKKLLFLARRKGKILLSFSLEK